MENFLTEEQKQFPYAKYFDMKFDGDPIPKELLDKINPDTPMDQSKALRLADINKLLDPNYAADDFGYCVTDDGSGYVGMTVFYPGATQEMFEWWFAWHGIEDTRYKIWDPKGHFGVKNSQRNLKKRTDPSLSWKERNWGTSDFIMAINVDGVKVNKVSFLNPVDFGFDDELLKKNNVSVVCALLSMPDEPIPFCPSIRVLHQKEDGLQVGLYFWYGWTIVNRKPIRLDNFHCEIALPRLQVTHCAEEYTKLGRMLPQIYAENHEIIDKYEDFQPMPF